MTDSDVQQWIEDENLTSNSSGIHSHSVLCIMQYLAMKKYNNIKTGSGSKSWKVVYFQKLQKVLCTEVRMTKNYYKLYKTKFNGEDISLNQLDTTY